MAFADLLDLRTAVVEHVGNPKVADVFGRLVALGEAYLNRELRLSQQMTQTTLTVSGGTATLPADFLEAIGVYNASGVEYVQQTQQASKQITDFYWIENGAFKTSGVDGSYALAYYAKVPALSTLTSTSWLLTLHPSLYLYTVAYEAAKYLRDVEGASVTKGLRDMELNDARGFDARTRYSRARVRVQGHCP